MKTIVMVLLTGLVAPLLAAASDVPPAAEQIAAAILAAPEEYRAEAAVIGYNAQGKLEAIREGGNQMVCLADNPAKEKLSVACYHKDLAPYMARGRELAAEGLSGKESHAIRWKEIEEGKLAMSRELRTLYVLSGSGFDAASGEVRDSHLRWVFYAPFATLEATGLSGKRAAAGAPWLMDPGTAGAHIMITPKRD